MSDEWISVADAISRLAEAKSIKREQAIFPLGELAQFGVVASRIASISDGRSDQPLRDVPMTRSHWDGILGIRDDDPGLQDDDWHERGIAAFSDDTLYIGIEINERDLEVYLESQRVKSKGAIKTSGARKRPGPKPDPDWLEAITEVTKDCIVAGYKKPLKRGDKAAIQVLLLNYMATKDRHFSDDTARKYAANVIAGLPDN